MFMTTCLTLSVISLIGKVVIIAGVLRHLARTRPERFLTVK
jgi:hypothetical protein